ncbi:hypothetical protein TVAG_003110 [Trichomonas vaginalis G3]|uniref:Cleavage/polyadenylation specificity factor A subunit C-terminal domain-containing protein n=1 Tax=Trichomonas vaginalis (strain ATCC PRA-98 / G3) TaxID=412133 RepID=A2EZT4_TRIV3|nr:hypothetical protein TVAGG3_0816780 [Trichomonas vaginalis G3]EAY01856.1 hypothetical protein TVAG_003110 [Trichomonas vaginalis G3]KAI5497588.1 hypothetical protein TVAGG3_0816780 [Trichomonas vaginalis G3]|eukprot:XP_001314403.1 hypothetical protein [Trichomonas vaginalis G3]
MLGFHSSIQKYTIFSESESIIIKDVSKYYTGTSITWGTFNENYIWTLNSENLLTISDFKKQFRKIASVQLDKSPEPYNLFETTNDLKTVLISYKGADFCYIFSFNKDTIDVNIKVLHEMKLLDATAGSTLNTFQILIVEDDKQDVLILNHKTLETTSKDLENTASGIISYKNSKATVLAFLYPDKVENPSKKNPVELDSPMVVHSNVFKSRIIIQDEENHIRGIDINNMSLDIDLEAPKLNQIFLLPNNLAFGVCDNGDNIIFTVNPSQEAETMQDNTVLDLESPLSIKSATIFHKKLYAADTRGVFSYEYSEFPRENNVPYETQPPFRLFTESMDSYAISSENGTEIIGNEDVIPYGQGRLLGLYEINENNSIFIYEDGIYQKESSKKIALRRCTACDYMDERLLIAFDHRKLVIFQISDFKKVGQTTIDIADDTVITAVAISENFTASSHYYENTGIASIILMDNEFNTKADIDVPSRVTSMIFVEEGKKLFVGMFNGTVLSTETNENGELIKHTYCYIGNPCIDVFFIRNPANDDEFFFADERLYHYYDSTIHEEQFLPMDAFCLYKDEIGVIFLSTAKEGNVTARNFLTENQSTHSFYIKLSIKNTIYIALAGNYGFALCVDNDHEFSIHVFDNENQEITSETFKGSVSTLIAHESKGRVKIIAADCGKSDTIHGIVYEDGKLSLKFTNKFETIISSICMMGHKVIFCTSHTIRVCKFIEDKLLFTYANTTLCGNVNMVVTHGRYIWCSVENYGIAVLTYNKKDDCLEGVGQYKKVTDKITAIAPIDDLTVAFSTERGDIFFTTIDINIVLGLNTFDMVSLPQLNICGRINIGRVVVFIFRNGNCIYYLLKDGTLGALLPAPLMTEFRRSERYQFNALSEYSEGVGFFHPGHSLAAQKGIIDIDFIECLNQQNIFPDADHASEVMAAISQANVNIVLK